MATTTSITNTYRMGYSDAIIKFMDARGADTEAFPLMPHLQPTDRILDLGCGPGSITVGLAPKVASVVALDVSGVSIDMTRRRVEQMREAGSLTAPDAAKITCLQADVLAGLPFESHTFDVIYASQVFVHLTGPGQAARAMAEVRRVLKSGGILATRDAAESFYYPRHSNLWDIWGSKMNRALLGHDAKFVADGKPGGPDMMPRLYRESGFEPQKIKVTSGLPWVFSGRTGREWCVNNWTEKMDDPSLLDKWVAAGVTDEHKKVAKKALADWLDNEDAYMMVTHCDILGWK
ncbi:putative methyltransferase [Colletotrichum spaethianum]|uniref:Methyltransferase n=1 Tax=Colletotrichum spaethianum TaxID=700344 RepID=A0AA37L9K5_9PEZI|nr:putative methyltransferase [Colletotrichum spaethianum]GKT44341.1 putative methyltransferase [Colletotrichum spaethianum]